MLSRNEARDIDRKATEEFGVPSIILMENAGRSIAEYIISCNVNENIFICCGKGNNGGDGFVIARHLDNYELPVHILLFSNPDDLKGDAKINHDIAIKSSIQITVVNNENLDAVLKEFLFNSKWIIDALFGTGLQGIVKPPYNKIIQAMNDSNAIILSVDIPSGLDCDTGEPLGTAVKATHTFTLAVLKKGFANPVAKNFLGYVHIVDIGIPKLLISKNRMRI